MRIYSPFSVLLALALVACGGGSAIGPAPLAKAAPRPSARMVITIVSASIDGKKADGTPWDDASAPGPPLTGGLLAAYLAAHAELEGTAALIGEPVDVPGVLASARRSSAPDPMVFVEVGGRTFRTTLAPGQFQPVWRFPIVVDISPDSTDIVHFTVVDWDGPGQLDVIGQKLIPARELFGHTLRLQIGVGEGDAGERHQHEGDEGAHRAIVQPGPADMEHPSDAHRFCYTRARAGAPCRVSPSSACRS